MQSIAIGELLGDLRWAILPLGILAYVVTRWWLRKRRRPVRNSVGDALVSFQASIGGMAAVVVGLMFSFSTPVLGSFGFPRIEDAVTDPRELLHLMRMYNRELVSASLGVQSLALMGMLVLATGVSLATAVVNSEQRGTGPARDGIDAAVLARPKADGRRA
jgi:hypothetical protein